MRHPPNCCGRSGAAGAGAFANSGAVSASTNTKWSLQSRMKAHQPSGIRLPGNGESFQGRSALLLLSLALFDFTGDLDPAQTADILGNSAIERFGDALAIVGGAELALVAGVADEGNLGQNRRHVRPNQNDEWSLLDSAVPQPRVLGCQAIVERVFHVAGELLGLFDLFLQCDLLHQVL